MAERYNIADISKISDRTVFFDANVIIFIFWSIYSSGNEPRHYSLIYKELLDNHNKMALNVTVLSEVTNRVLRIEWNSQTNRLIDYKVFRNSEDGLQVQAGIFDIIKDTILPTFSIIDEQLSVSDIKKLLVVDSLDFNDKIITDVCKSQNMILLTHDADFKDVDIDILSANSRLCS